MKELILNYWYIPIVIGLLFIFGLIIKGFRNVVEYPYDYEIMSKEEMKAYSQHIDEHSPEAYFGENEEEIKALRRNMGIDDIEDTQPGEMETANINLDFMNEAGR